VKKTKGKIVFRDKYLRGKGGLVSKLYLRTKVTGDQRVTGITEKKPIEEKTCVGSGACGLYGGSGGHL